MSVLPKDNMAKTYFEEKGLALLEKKGISKAEFARRMGIQRQNVNILFKTKNFYTIQKAAQVLDVPFELLIGYTSEPEIPPAEIPDEENIPSAFGPFGNIYTGFEGKPKEAFWFLIDHQEGDLRAVFRREDTGPIDLIWGDANCGVRHILEKHINQKDFPTVNQMIERITLMIHDGTISYDNADKVVLKKDGYLAIIRKNYRLDGKKPEPKTWVLTAYAKESSDTTSAPPGIH